jgi:hypothetical protein
MPIAIDGQVYPDELSYTAKVLGISMPEEASGEEQTQGGTQVPPEENNAPASQYGGSRGILEQGNIDLHKRPIVKNPDGSISTVRSMSIGTDKGEVLIPTVAADGSGILSDEDAIAQYNKTGQHLGIFDTPENATAYAESLHNQQAEEYLPKRGILDNLLGLTGERYQTWPEKAVRGAVSAMALPGDVLSGKVQPGSIQEIEKAMDLAGLMVFGPAPVASKMADGTLGSFIGVKAKTFDKNALAQAQLMEHNGVHPDDIFRETGMFRGAEKRWKSEISDAESKLKEDWHLNGVMDDTPVNVKLSDVLEHPKLYEAYPQLKDLEVKYDPNYNGAFYSEYPNRSITVGPAYVNNKDTYLHEIQHAIQDIEGFAKGGSAVKDPKLRFDEDIENLKNEFFAMNKPLSAEGRERAKYIYRVLSLDILRRQAAYKEAVNNYMKLAGEAEARNVETRALLKEGENRNYAPWYSEDVPRHEQHSFLEPMWATPYGYSFNKYSVPK